MSQYDDNDDMAIAKLIELGSNIYNTAVTVDYNNKKLEATNNMANANLLAQFENNKMMGNHKVQKEMIDKEILETNIEIETLKNNMSGYDVNYMEYFNLDDKDKGPFGQQILDDIGVKYGENLAYSAEIADNSVEQLENNKNLLSLTYKIRDELQVKYNNILDLQDDYLKVRDDGVYKGVSKIKEYNDYIAENPETFAMKDEDGSIIYEPDTVNKDGKTIKGDFIRNPLANAFISERQTVTLPGGTGTRDYGYYKPYTTQEMEAAGYNPKTGILKSEEKKSEINTNYNAAFTRLEKSVGRTKKVDNQTINDNKGQSKWINSLNLEQIDKYKGAKDLWENRDDSITLKNELEQIIYKAFDKSTTYRWSSTPEIQEDRRVEWAMDDNDGTNRVAKTLSSPKLRNEMIGKIYNLYLAETPVKMTDSTTGQEFIKYEKGPVSSGNVNLKKQYEIDKIYHDKWASGEYSGDAHDAVIHDLLYLWKQVDDAFPSVVK